ncbi:hypothetical protein QFZ25_000520 [Bacillus atrophaeus]|nr:PqqD family protein [Bacillus atrophaeus]MDQ0926460.1 hypothetical protein [Bacillus atrophaeus]
MKPKKNLFVRSRAIQGKLYIINKHDAYLLDSTEEFIWGSIDGENELEDIIKKVAVKYDENPSDIQQDIEEFINSLQENNLIKY